MFIGVLFRQLRTHLTVDLKTVQTRGLLSDKKSKRARTRTDFNHTIFCPNPGLRDRFLRKRFINQKILSAGFARPDAKTANN